jgi:hypothetical protein
MDDDINNLNKIKQLLYRKLKISNMLIAKMNHMNMSYNKYIKALETHVTLTSKIINYFMEQSIYIELPPTINTKYYPKSNRFRLS